MYKPTEKKGLGKFWLVSIGVHVGILCFGLIGSLFTPPTPEVAPPPIYVEFAPVAETAMAPTKGKEIQSQKKKEPEPEPVEEKKPQPKAAEEPTPEPPKEELKKADEKPKEDKKTTEKAKDSPKAEKKPEDKKKETAKPKKDTKEQEKSFDALLKNLSDTPDDTKAGDVDIKASDKSDEPSGLPDYAAQLTISEFDALRQQLARCWNIPAGAQDAANLVIEVKVAVNQDRVATSASVVDQIRYNTDTYFRAAADSAVRAVQSPSCTPLELPADKYDAWKSMIIVFDPREMF